MCYGASNLSRKGAKLAPKPEVPDLSEFVPTRRGPPCRLSPTALEVSGLTDDQRIKLQAALDSRLIQGTRIAAVVTEWGYRVPAETVNRHRRGICSCDRGDI